MSTKTYYRIEYLTHDGNPEITHWEYATHARTLESAIRLAERVADERDTPTRTVKVYGKSRRHQVLHMFPLLVALLSVGCAAGVADPGTDEPLAPAKPYAVTETPLAGEGCGPLRGKVLKPEDVCKGFNGVEGWLDAPGAEGWYDFGCRDGLLAWAHVEASGRVLFSLRLDGIGGENPGRCESEYELLPPGWVEPPSPEELATACLEDATLPGVVLNCEPATFKGSAGGVEGETCTVVGNGTGVEGYAHIRGTVAYYKTTWGRARCFLETGVYESGEFEP